MEVGLGRTPFLFLFKIPQVNKIRIFEVMQSILATPIGVNEQKHDSKWKQSIESLIQATREGLDGKTANAALHCMMGLTFGGRGAYDELLQSAGCPAKNNLDRTTSKLYTDVLRKHVPDLHRYMDDVFPAELCHGYLEEALDTLNLAYRQAIPQAMVDDLNDLCLCTFTYV